MALIILHMDQLYRNIIPRLKKNDHSTLANSEYWLESNSYFHKQ